MSVAQAVVGVGLSALGWGGLGALLAHPARAALVVLSLVFTLVALVSPVNLSSGQREDVENRRLFVPGAAGVLLLAWLMPFMDRRDVWTIDGDAARYLGVATLVIGGTLRIWPIFVLGRSFSGLVAIQPGHELVTHGLDLAALEAQADHDEGLFGDHLRRLLVSLTQDPALSDVVRGVLQGQPCPTPESFYRLRSAGLMLGDSARDVRPRCQLYATYLERHLL